MSKPNTEAYPPGWKHVTVHISPSGKEHHADGPDPERTEILRLITHKNCARIRMGADYDIRVFSRRPEDEHTAYDLERVLRTRWDQLVETVLKPLADVWRKDRWFLKQQASDSVLMINPISRHEIPCGVFQRAFELHCAFTGQVAWSTDEIGPFPVEYACGCMSVRDVVCRVCDEHKPKEDPE